MHKILSATTVLVGMSLIANHATAQIRNYFTDYDPLTGEVILSGLENVGGIYIEGPNLNKASANNLGGFVDGSVSNALGWLLFSPLNGDNFNLGSIFPPSLLTSELDSEYAGGLVFTGSGVSDWRANALSFAGNGRAVAEAGGPYKIGIGEDLILDPQGTFHSSTNILSLWIELLWDLDLDGEYDDAVDSYSREELPAGSFPGGISPELIQPLAIEYSQLPERF